MRITYAFTYLIIGGLIGFIINDHQQADVSPTSIPGIIDSSTCTADASRLTDTITFLEYDHQQLHRRYLELLAQNKVQTPGEINPQQPANQSDITQQLTQHLAAIDYARTFSQSLTDKILSKPNYNFSQDIEQQFFNQPVDPSWSVTRENHLQELFQSHAELRQLALESIECRTDGCQVKLLVADFHAADQTRDALINAITAGTGKVSPVVIAAPHPESHQLNLYIARSNDKQLLQ
ncbi:MAG TPA: hypothetical protein VLE50_06455 [Cellvibrio sp.]|nr:hypothetical protein [Cellvibrio sp.]